MKAYLDLFLTFAKIGAILFGGGYAMLPYLEKEIVSRKGWATRSQILDFLAIGQSTPGIIAVNVCSFVGHRRKGWPGAIVATIGFIFPAVIIITLIAGVMMEFADSEVVQHAFGGIRIVVAALIITALLKFSKGVFNDIRGILIGFSAFCASAIMGLSPVLIVITAALVGVLLYRKDKSSVRSCKTSLTEAQR